MRAPEISDVVAILGSSIHSWDAKAVSTPQGARAAYEGLAERLINYFGVYYAVQPVPTLPGDPLANRALPGLPGGPRL